MKKDYFNDDLWIELHNTFPRSLALLGTYY
jgi:hypothetical protein